MRRFQALAAILLALTIFRVSGADLLPFKATEKTLPNGLKVIIVPTGFPNIVALQIPVKTGSRNEVEPGKSGFAHFFEHMMFRGTKEYPPERYQQIITKAGAQQNAFTTDDYTNYHITFAKEDLETILKIEADRFQNLSYSEPAFKTESRAVLGEYNKNSAEPLQKLSEVQREHGFTTHTYRHTTMGFLKDIEDMPNQYAYSKTFFDRWYRPENAVLILAGDVDPTRAMPLVEKYWGSWKGGRSSVTVPQEPPATGPVYAHVPWTTPTLPYVAVAFHGPAFSETGKEFAAIDLLYDLSFGRTSDLYKRLVEQEQKVDQLSRSNPKNEDPPLHTVIARVKKPDDALYVRDQILRTFADLRETPVSEKRLADAKSNARYALSRTFDNTESIASTLARFVRYRRSFDTLNNYYRVVDTLTPADLLSAAKRSFTDANLVVTTLSKEPMPAAIAQIPALASAAPAATTSFDVPLVEQKSSLPQLEFKLLFTAGSAHDPKGKEGLAALSASMIAEAGSKEMRIDEIARTLFPVAGSFRAQVDKEMTTFTGVIHKDNWRALLDAALPQLLSPGFREEDFKRIKDAQMNALTQNLRRNNEEELAKERLQTEIFAGTPYGHPVLGTVAGIETITLDDVKTFVKSAYTRGALTLGIAGDVPDEMAIRLKTAIGNLPPGPGLPVPAGVAGKKPSGIEVEIIGKDTRATAISFGHPIEVTRSHPDFVALSVARAWLGEHRASNSHLYQTIRELRGMNYGDYAYIEAFPRGMFRFLPDPNIARRSQIFEIWIRPVVPENAHMALRIAIFELDKLIRNGLSREDFESTRDYLMKNVYLMTATQDQQLGYALDSKWYGTDEFTKHMRERLAGLTLENVNTAIRKHLSSRNLAAVIITKDAEGLRSRLVADAFSPITYESEKPREILEEDKVIGALKLGIRPEAVRITPADDVFSR